jgi:hypothetical protein
MSESNLLKENEKLDEEVNKISGCPFFTKKSHDSNNNITNGAGDLHYNNYLQLDKILNAQDPVTTKLNVKAHDEHLFIVIHQGKTFLSLKI